MCAPGDAQPSPARGPAPSSGVPHPDPRCPTRLRCPAPDSVILHPAPGPTPGPVVLHGPPYLVPSAIPQLVPYPVLHGPHYPVPGSAPGPRCPSPGSLPGPARSALSRTQCHYLVPYPVPHGPHFPAPGPARSAVSRARFPTRSRQVPAIPCPAPCPVPPGPAPLRLCRRRPAAAAWPLRSGPAPSLPAANQSRRSLFVNGRRGRPRMRRALPPPCPRAAWPCPLLVCAVTPLALGVPRSLPVPKHRDTDRASRAMGSGRRI